jgi:Amt family ammonium transporter
MKRLLSALTILMILGMSALLFAEESETNIQSSPTAQVLSLKPDPSGANTGGAADVVGATANAPTGDDLKTLSSNEPLAAKLADVVGHNRIAINMVWTLVAGFLVMFMQAGFAMVEAGFTQAKNAAHTMAMNFMVYGLGMLGYWLCGFALQMGGVGAGPLDGGTGLLDGEFVIRLFGKDFGSGAQRDSFLRA